MKASLSFKAVERPIRESQSHSQFESGKEIAQSWVDDGRIGDHVESEVRTKVEESTEEKEKRSFPPLGCRPKELAQLSIF